MTDIPGFDFGPYGSAEKPNGELRQLAEDEARDVGLLDGTYDQVRLPEVLEQNLAR
ncbi:hypothetical protein ACFQ1S_03085 [Kibdelosporangium lantanae]|uniref:Uncharacterized protein n=1 Tax=Kibdelosporangium lantanae TaxID=1497396 RepID=A0ABW3M5J4_9PSEU